MAPRSVAGIVVAVFVVANVARATAQAGSSAGGSRMEAAAAGEWEEWYLPSPDGCTLYVKEVGRGSPLVVLHGGWGAEHSYLLDAFDYLESNYRLIFYDQRGSLRSPCPDSLVSVGRHVADLERLRVALKLDRVTLLAHSMGTFLAMSYLQEYPKRVSGMILIGAILPRTPATSEERTEYQEEQKKFVAFAHTAEADELTQEGLDVESLTVKDQTRRWRIAFASGNLYHVDRWRQMQGGQVFFAANAARAAGKSMPEEWNFVPALDALSSPVTVINGDHDLVGFGGELHRKVLAEARGVEFVLLPGAGHNSWIDQPEQFRTELNRALEKYHGPSQPQ